MSVIREIIDSEKLMTIMELPEEMRTGQVEVCVYPVNTNIEPRSKPMKSMRGVLSKYANPALVPLEKEAWANHVVEKYGNP